MQLLQTAEQKESKVETMAFDTFMTSFNQLGWNSQVCKHSVIVVASMK